jgi:two-component system cell cycle response regulator CtrA
MPARPECARTGLMQCSKDLDHSITLSARNTGPAGTSYQMLELLSLREGTPITKEMFLNHLYGGMDEPTQKIIDVFICKLRKKLGKNYIQTAWGHGHSLREPPGDDARISA